MATFNADWTPTAGGCWVGAAVKINNAVGGTQADLTLREGQLGRKFDFHMRYEPINTTLTGMADEQWSFDTDGALFNVITYPGASATTVIPDIVAGTQDANIYNFGNAVKSLNGKVIIRLFWEMSLNGSPFQAANYSGNYATFIKAWKRVWTILFGNATGPNSYASPADGGTPISGTPLKLTNAVFCWSPNRYFTNQGDDYKNYFPGDQWLSNPNISGSTGIIALDSYPKNQYLTIDQLLGSYTGILRNFYQWATTADPTIGLSGNVPLMIGETGTQASDKIGTTNTRAQWHQDTLTKLKTVLPRVKWYTYFDELASSGLNWSLDAPGTVAGDTGTQALAAFASTLQDPYFNQQTVQGPVDTNYGVWSDDAVPVFFAPPFKPLDYTPLAADGYVTKSLSWSTIFKNTVSPATVAAGSRVTTTLGAGPNISGKTFDTSTGLYQFDNRLPTSQQPQTKTSIIAGFSCRAAITAGARRKVYFGVDHHWKYQMANGVALTVTVQYYDAGFNGTTDNMTLIYDGQSGNVTHGTTITLGNSKTWKVASWAFTDGYFGGRLLSVTGIGSLGDFYLESPDTADLWFNKVQVVPTNTTDNTYFYLVDPSNTGNVQRRIGTKARPDPQTVQSASQPSAQTVP